LQCLPAYWFLPLRCAIGNSSPYGQSQARVSHHAAPQHQAVATGNLAATQRVLHAPDFAVGNHRHTHRGADELVVHARTKAHGYRPPAYWERIADVRAAVRVPVVANGEIWSVQDALRCREVSGCDQLMLGRGMVADPGLALAIRAASAGDTSDRNEELSWQALQPLMADFWHIVCAKLERRQQAGRLKQWLNYLRRRHPEAEVAYMALRTVTVPAEIDAWLTVNWR
jgi:tRNA-dihydrouridine synthase